MKKVLIALTLMTPCVSYSAASAASTLFKNGITITMQHGDRVFKLVDGNWVWFKTAVRIIEPTKTEQAIEIAKTVGRWTAETIVLKAAHKGIDHIMSKAEQGALKKKLDENPETLTQEEIKKLKLVLAAVKQDEKK